MKSYITVSTKLSVVRITCSKQGVITIKHDNPKVKFTVDSKWVFDMMCNSISLNCKDMGVRRRAYQLKGYSLPAAIIASEVSAKTKKKSKSTK